MEETSLPRNSPVPARSVAHVPTIACFNRSNIPLGVDFDALIAALQNYVDQHLAPVWGTPAKLVKSTGFLKGKWALGLFADYRDASLAGFHDVTPDGLPFAKIFVFNTLEQGDKVSVTASHEVAEMLVDPGANLYSAGPKAGRLYDYEVSDPVEEMSFKLDGLQMCNFVYPAYFETFHKPGSVRFDHMGRLRQPFELDKGGYQSYWVNGTEKTAWGSDEKKVRFEKEDRRGHRTTLHNKSKLKHSVERPLAK
jgi:hypothetical protein